MRPLIFLYSHPIQYFAPLCRRTSEDSGAEVWVLYCSRQGVEQRRDKEFGQPIRWDIPLLEGYRSRFFANWRGESRVPRSFWSLINPEVWWWLWRMPPSVVVVHGWGYLTHVVAIMVGKWRGHTICLRGESAWCHERLLPPWKAFLKKWLLARGLFRFVDFFLYIGRENRAFYRYYGVPDSRLIYTPYGVDNERFSAQWATLKEAKTALRRRLGLPAHAVIALFCGKLIPKKRPLDLLEAFRRAAVPNSVLIYVGDGALRTQIEQQLRNTGLEKNVQLVGFVNQSTIGQYYAAADLFVMCSDVGETWGLATNEAMNFALPVLLSDRTGCAADLCHPGVNGFIFPTGDIDALSRYLRRLMTLPAEQRRAMGEASRAVVARYHYGVFVDNMRRLLNASEFAS
jgi:glycosyltransferase involved in cell wall biosynthesis